MKILSMKTILKAKKVYPYFFNRFARRRRQQSGIILIVVLWVLVILSMVTMGLGRRAAIELELTKFSMRQVKLRHVAMAGVQYAIHHIHERSKQEGGDKGDTKYQCGFVLQEGRRPQEIFKDVPMPEGSFSIVFNVDGEGDGTERYGFTDEGSRININQLGPFEYGIFQNLLEDVGVEAEVAKYIASALIDWRDENQEVFNVTYGAEQDYYSSLERPYPCKDGPFDSIEELLLVRGMTPDIFNRIKPYVTVFSSNMKLTLNLNTAPRPCLKALARHYAGAKTNTEQSDADSLVEKLVAFRNGPDELWATEDDVPVRIDEMPLNAKERVIGFLMRDNQAAQSSFFRVNVKARDEASGYATHITAVIRAQDGAIVYWRR